MDSDAIRKKRQEEIESKRKRLVEMRKAKEESAARTAAPAAAPLVTKAEQIPTPAKSEEDVNLETEELVNSLLTEPLKATTLAPSAVDAENKSRETLLREKLACFSTVKSFNVIDILPVSKEVYEKGTQMEEEDLLFLNGSEMNPDFVEESEPVVDDEDDEDVSNSTPMKGMRSPVSSKGLFSSSKTPRGDDRVGSALGADAEVEALFAARAATKLTEEERAKITAGASFQNFLRTSSLYVERALALTEEHDVIRDFSADDQSNSGDLDEHSAFILPVAGSSSSAVASTYEDEHVAGRPVMDLQWSHMVPELFLAAYGAKQLAPSAGSVSSSTAKSGTTSTSSSSSSSEEEAPGVVCVWSRDLHGRPEFRFTASSPVLAAAFHSHEQHLVLGGCYSGQILLWDMKLNKALPVQRSSMSGKGHKHPVYAMAMTSSAVAAELVSVSSDGLLCHWDVSRLAEPLSAVQLHLPTLSANPASALGLSGFLSPIRDLPHSASSGQSPLNISAMAFAHSAADHSSGAAGDAVGAADLIFGCGSGQLVRTPLPYKDNHPGAAKVEAHFGFVTSIVPHPSRSNKYKHLLLSSSLDWTVKLWDLKDFAQPIFEFFTPSYDYVCDVQWSPVHPAVFVTVTSGGRLCLWNLARSTTEPVDALTIGPEMEDGGAGASAAGAVGTAAAVAVAGAGGASTRALNKVVWARDGQAVLCGDSRGTLHLLRLYPAAALSSPQEESRFESAIVSRAADQSSQSHLMVAAEESKTGTAMASADITPKKKVGGAEFPAEDMAGYTNSAFD